MKILFLAHSDYGNSGYYFSKALEAVGQDCRCAVERPHVFEYPEQGDTHFEWGEVEENIQWADVVHIIQSDLPICMGGEYPPTEFWDSLDAHMIPPGMKPQLTIAEPPEWLKDLSAERGIDPYAGLRVGKWGPNTPHRLSLHGHNRVRPKWLNRLKREKVVVQHGGSFYRQIPEYYNTFWDGVVDATISHEGDLMDLGAPNEHLFIPPVDIKYLEPKDRVGHKKLVVGHYPGSTKTKGTPQIWRVMEKFGDRLEYRQSQLREPNGAFFDGGCETVLWPEQIARMRECDVIIDQIKPELQGKQFGEWCSLAIEAAGLGCITIANSLKPWHYHNTYGRMPGIHLCNNMEELEEEIERLLGLTRAEITAEQNTTRKWVEDYHTFKPTGERLMEQVYGDLR